MTKIDRDFFGVCGLWSGLVDMSARITIHITSVWMAYGCLQAPVRWARGLANDHFGVIRVILTMHQSLPVYPEKQTTREPVSTSQKWQTRTGSIFPLNLARGLKTFGHC